MRRGCLYIKGVISNPGHSFHHQQPAKIVQAKSPRFVVAATLPCCYCFPCISFEPREETDSETIDNHPLRIIIPSISYPPVRLTTYEMNALTSFYVVPILWNCILVSSSILTPLKTEDSLRIFKETPNDFEYVLKRHGINGRSDDSDSKERRSTMGSSFIRFGRSQLDGNMENTGLSGDLDGDSKVNRYPRWKSPDIVIRFGRSGFKGVNGEQVYKRGRNDLNFIRFGRNVEVIPLDMDVDPMMLNLELAKICSSLLSNDGAISREFHPQTARLMRLCNPLNNSDDDYSNTLRFLDEQADSKHQ